MLVVVAPDSVPQPGEQALPLAVSVQVTPLLLESFCTVALTTKGLLPVLTVLKLLLMVTLSAGVIVKLSESDLLLLATEVAVSVG